MEWYSQLFQRWNSYITNIAIKEMLDDIKQTKNEETLKFFSDFVMSIANSETLSLLLLDRKSGGNQDSNRRDSPFNVVLTAGSGSNPPELRSYSAAEAVYAPGSPRHLLERLLVLSHEEDLGRMWPKGQLFPLKKSSSIEDDAIKQLLSGTDYDEDDDQNQLREDSTTSASASSASSESDQEEKIVSEISANAPEDADLLELYVAALNSRSGAVGKTIKSTLDSEQFNIFAAEDSPNNSRTLPRAVFREKEFVVDIRTLGKELLQRRAAVANRMNDTIVSFLRDSYEGNVCFVDNGILH